MEIKTRFSQLPIDSKFYFDHVDLGVGKRTFTKIDPGHYYDGTTYPITNKEVAVTRVINTTDPEFDKIFQEKAEGTEKYRLIIEKFAVWYYANESIKDPNYLTLTKEIEASMREVLGEGFIAKIK